MRRRREVRKNVLTACIEVGSLIQQRIPSAFARHRHTSWDCKVYFTREPCAHVDPDPAGPGVGARRHSSEGSLYARDLGTIGRDLVPKRCKFLGVAYLRRGSGGIVKVQAFRL